MISDLYRDPASLPPELRFLAGGGGDAPDPSATGPITGDGEIDDRPRSDRR